MTRETTTGGVACGISGLAKSRARDRQGCELSGKPLDIPPGRVRPPANCCAPADALVQDMLSAYCSRGTSPTMRAVAWARVSTDMQEERGLSIPGQLREIRAYAARHGIEIVEEFHEAASAFHDEAKRAEFHRMLATARSDPSIDLILVHDYSRFSRDSLGARLLVRDLRQAGIQVVSLNDPPFDVETPTGVLIEAVTFAKNEAYSREMSFHVRKGFRANIQTRDPETGWNYKNGGSPPWGYRGVNSRRGKRANRPAIKRIWEMDNTVVSGKRVHEWARYCLVEMAGNGAALRELADFCRARSLTAQGARLSVTSWYKRLAVPSLLRYAGYGVWGVGHEHRGAPSLLPDWMVVPNAHPAIITPEEAITIIETRREVNNHAFTHGRNADHHLGGGMFLCSRCAQPMLKFGDSYVCRMHIPTQSGQRFRLNPATDSDPIRPPIPGQSGQGWSEARRGVIDQA